MVLRRLAVSVVRQRLRSRVSLCAVLLRTFRHVASVTLDRWLDLSSTADPERIVPTSPFAEFSAEIRTQSVSIQFVR